MHIPAPNPNLFASESIPTFTSRWYATHKSTTRYKVIYTTLSRCRLDLKNYSDE
jgi:hypothetical protein